MWASTASALYACGYEEQSSTMFAQSWLNQFDFSWNKFNGMLQKFLPQHHITVKHEVKIDDIFVEDEDILFQVLQLVDSFGNESHCVTASANTIFDSNEKYGLPFTRESLDRCVTSPAYPCTAVHVKRVIKIHNVDNSLSLLNQMFVTIIRTFNQCGDTVSAKYFEQYFATKTGIRKKNDKTVLKQCVKVFKRLVNEPHYKTFVNVQIVDTEATFKHMSNVCPQLKGAFDTKAQRIVHNKNDVVVLLQFDKAIPTDVTLSVYLLDAFVQNITTKEGTKTKIITNINEAKTTETTSMEQFIIIKRNKNYYIYININVFISITRTFHTTVLDHWPLGQNYGSQSHNQ